MENMWLSCSGSGDNCWLWQCHCTFEDKQQNHERHVLLESCKERFSSLNHFLISRGKRILLNMNGIAHKFSTGQIRTLT